MKTQVNDVWKVEDSTATLKTDAVAGTVDLESPDSGVTISNVFGKPVSDCSILEFAHVPKVERTNSDKYIRGEDLVASYQSEDDLRLKDQVYWRYFSLADPENFNGIELVASLQTDRLDLQPRVKLHSHLSASKVSLVKEGSGEIHIDPITENLDTDPSGVVALLVQNEEQEWSYLQSLHFTDEYSCDRIRVSVHEASVEIDVLLQVDHLEKGVIRRVRIRGAFSDASSCDKTALQQWFTEFAQSELPLTV